MPVADLSPVFALLDLLAFIILLLLAVCIVRVGVFWGLKDFEKWKDRPRKPAIDRTRAAADAKMIAARMEEEARRPAGPREEAQYRR